MRWFLREAASRSPVTLDSADTLRRVRDWLATSAEGASHQGFPVVDADGLIVSVVTRRVLLDQGLGPETMLGDLPLRPPVLVYDDCTLRDAADHMVRHGIGRLPVIERRTGTLIGMLTRSDILGAHSTRLREADEPRRHLRWRNHRAGSGRTDHPAQSR